MDSSNRGAGVLLDRATLKRPPRAFRRHGRHFSITEHVPSPGRCDRCAATTVEYAIWDDHAEFERALCGPHGRSLWARSDALFGGSSPKEGR